MNQLTGVCSLCVFSLQFFFKLKIKCIRVKFIFFNKYSLQKQSEVYFQHIWNESFQILKTLQLWAWRKCFGMRISCSNWNTASVAWFCSGPPVHKADDGLGSCSSHDGRRLSSQLPASALSSPRCLSALEEQTRRKIPFFLSLSSKIIFFSFQENISSNYIPVKSEVKM